MGVYAVDKLMVEARRIAAEYRKMTGSPLGGISVEIAEFDAARLLGLELIKNSPAGYDAIGHGKREGKRIQIKGRAIFDESKSGHRIGQLKLDKEWDSVVLVIMDEQYEPVEIYECDRTVIQQAVEEGGTSRSKRGAMSVAKFRAIGTLVWAAAEGTIGDELWQNQPPGDVDRD